MSSTKDILLLDSRCNVSEETSQVIPISSLQSITFQQPASGTTFDTSCLFSNIVTPSLATTLVSRCIPMSYTLRVCYPSVAAGGVTPAICLPKDKYDPSYVVNANIRAFPLQSVTDSLILSINGASSTINSRQVLSALQRTLPKEFRAKQASTCPAAFDDRAFLIPDLGTFHGAWQSAAAYGADTTVVTVVFSNGFTGSFTCGAAYPANGTRVRVTCTQYPDLYCYWIASAAFVANQAIPVYVDQAVTCNSSMSKYEASSDMASRGSFKAESFLQNQAVAGLPTMTYGWDCWQYRISEILQVSPLTIFQNEAYLGLVNTLSVQLNYSATQDMVVMAGTVPAANINLSNLYCTVMGSQTPTLELSYLTLDPKIVSIPKSINYDYCNVVYFPRSGSTMALSSDSVQTLQIQSDNIRFTMMPSKIYMFVRQALSSRTSVGASNFAGKSADAFLSLGDVTSGNMQMSITMGTRSGIFSAASRRQVYESSVRNGYEGSYETWCYGSGGLCVFDPVLDAGVNLDTDSIPGESSSSVNFQVALTCNSSNYQYVASTQAGRETLGVPSGQCPLELMVIAVYSGTAVVSAETVLYNLGEITPSQVATLIKHGPHDGTMMTTESLMPTIKGGSLFTKKHIFHKTAHGRK